VAFTVRSNLLLISVQHTGTRFTQQLLEGWGLRVEQLHTSEDKVFNGGNLVRPAVIPIRNPLMCFISWWKYEDDYIDQDTDFGHDFFRQWGRLDELLDLREKRKSQTIIFYIDKDDPPQLAERLGVEYKPVSIRPSSHYISDRFIQPVYKNFPPALQELATRWGYGFGETLPTNVEQVVAKLAEGK